MKHTIRVLKIEECVSSDYIKPKSMYYEHNSVFLLLIITHSNNRILLKEATMDINNVYVRDAILYYTIQQYFNCNDKKTSQFIVQLDHFNYRR